MSKKIAQFLFHLIAAGENGFGLYYDLFVVEFPETEFMWHDKFGGHFKFLTTQNMLIQTVYFLIALINDIIGTNDPDIMCNLPPIRIFRDYFFAAFSFPIAIYVSYQFWSLYFFKRDAVLPPVFYPVIPSWFNHMEHTVISVLACAEMLICFRAYPDLGTGLIILYSYCIAYLIWLHIVKYVRGFWIYPIFNDFSLKQRYIFLALTLLSVLFIYLLGELINNGYWSNELGAITYGVNKPYKVQTKGTGTDEF